MAFLKNIWKSNSKHHKLSEELALQSSKSSTDSVDIMNDSDLVTFKLKYLGGTVVEKIIGDNIAAEAVKSILKLIKTQKKKPQRVNLSVSLKGVAVADLKGNDILKISIYRISNCCTDPSHPQIFSFTSTDAHETTECHAFSCGKRKFAETVALTVAHAFTTAYEEWRILPSTKEFAIAMETKEVQSETSETNDDKKNQENNGKNKENQLIEFEDEGVDDLIDNKMNSSRTQFQLQNIWVSFDDETVLVPQSAM